MKIPFLLSQITIWGWVVLGSVLMAQNTRTSSDYFQKAKSLFDSENYRSAQVFFRRSAKQARHFTDRRKANAYELICTKKLGYKSFQASAEHFLQLHPHCTEATQIRFHLGDYYFQQGKYELAQIYFREIHLSNPQTVPEIETTYKLAYVFFCLKKYDEARDLLNLIKIKNHPYQDAVWYYSGYIRYLDKDYEGAFRDLRRVSSEFPSQIQLQELITEVLFLSQNFEKVIRYTKDLLKDNPNHEKLNLMMGTSFYQLKNYEKALPFLKKVSTYYTDNQEVNFQIGICLLNLSQPLEAIEYLRIASESGQDEARIWYHLGVACAKVKGDYLTMAQEAFKKARKPSQWGHLHELSALNYAKMSYEIKDYTATLEGCEFYQQNYPDGEFSNEVKYLITNTCLYGDNDSGAVNFLKKIKHKTPEMKQAYQRVLYNKAVELMEIGNLKEAQQTLQMSLNYPYNENLIHRANYWLGEIGFRMNQFQDALQYYFRVPSEVPEYVKALYGIGYAYYNLSEYQNARLFFEDFLSQNWKGKRGNPDQMLEVQIRIADCFFAEKNYGQALQNYQKLQDSNYLQASQKGHLFFQKGLTLSSLKKYLEAIDSFEEVVSNFVDMPYIEDTYWHKAIAHKQISEYEKALSNLNQLISISNSRTLKATAILERGKIFLKKSKLKEALADFRRVIYRYPQTTSAILALYELQKLNNGSTIEIPDFQRLVQYLGQKNTTFLAERMREIRQLYQRKKFHVVIGEGSKFNAQFPNSHYEAEAKYWVGAAFWKLQDRENALKILRQIHTKDTELTRKVQRKIREIETYRIPEKITKKEPQKPLANIQKMLKDKDFVQAKNALHAHYFRNDIEGEKAVFWTMQILEAEENWASVEATFYDFKKRFPHSKKYYGTVLMMAKALNRLGKKNEAKGYLEELLEHCPNRNWQIQAKALLHQL